MGDGKSMKPKIDYSLYLVTDRDLMSTPTLEQAVEQAIEGGCTLIQLREKEASSLKFYQTAKEIKKIATKYQIPLIINDRVDLALAVDADGVHVGQSDLPAKVVRGIIGDNKILGVSVANLEEAIKAKLDGADYLGVGAMFTTHTKTNTRRVSLDLLKQIKEEVQLPVVAIGGINPKVIPEFRGSRIDGIAVVSAIISEKDIKSAANELRTLFYNTMN